MSTSIANITKTVAAATAIACVAGAGSYFAATASYSDGARSQASTLTLEDQIFRRFDLDRDENLTLKELNRALPTQTVSRTLNYRFGKLDSDRDGEVTRTELQRNRSYLMNFIDLNGNQKLDPDERNYVSEIFQ